jgi:hypothetical protein
MPSMTLDMLLSQDWLGTGELCLWCNIDDSLIKLQYDLYYIKHKFLSIWILKTITTVLFYR